MVALHETEPDKARRAECRGASVWLWVVYGWITISFAEGMRNLFFFLQSSVLKMSVADELVVARWKSYQVNINLGLMNRSYVAMNDQPFVHRPCMHVGNKSRSIINTWHPFNVIHFQREKKSGRLTGSCAVGCESVHLKLKDMCLSPWLLMWCIYLRLHYLTTNKWVFPRPRSKNGFKLFLSLFMRLASLLSK